MKALLPHRVEAENIRRIRGCHRHIRRDRPYRGGRTEPGIGRRCPDPSDHLWVDSRRTPVIRFTIRRIRRTRFGRSLRSSRQSLAGPMCRGIGRHCPVDRRLDRHRLLAGLWCRGGRVDCCRVVPVVHLLPGGLTCRGTGLHCRDARRLVPRRLRGGRLCRDGRGVRCPVAPVDRPSLVGRTSRATGRHCPEGPRNHRWYRDGRLCRDCRTSRRFRPIRIRVCRDRSRPEVEDGREVDSRRRHRGSSRSVSRDR